MKSVTKGANEYAAANDHVFDPANPYHEVVSYFRQMPDPEYQAMKESIKSNGLRETIKTQNGKIIDGRHRHMACLEVGIEPRYEEIDGRISPTKYCLDMNMVRRHLTEFDKVELANRIGRLPVGSNQHTAGAGRSQAYWAEFLDISPDTLQRGNKILRDGSPELKDAVRAGKVSVSTGAKLAELPKQQQSELADGDIKKIATALNVAKKKKKREEKVQLCMKLAANSPTFDGIEPCSVIYADPPWEYLGFDGTPYPTMKLDKLCAMGDQIASVTTKHAAMFIWVPSSQLPIALKVIEAWGFTYKTSAVWDKQLPGQGVYFRQQHEFLLVAIKGKPPCVDLSATPSSVIREKRTDHSRKPDCVYEMIEQMYPELNKLELFSRSERAGWTMWGNQAGERQA